MRTPRSETILIKEGQEGKKKATKRRSIPLAAPVPEKPAAATVPERSIYIIGMDSISSEWDRRKLENTQRSLERAGYLVSNMGLKDRPDLTWAMIKRENYSRLIDADAVYLMPHAAINRDNLELRIAADLNLLVIQGAIFVAQ